MKYRVAVAGVALHVEVSEDRVSVARDGSATPALEGDARLLRVTGALHALEVAGRVTPAIVERGEDGSVTVGLPGKRRLKLEVEDGRAPPTSAAGASGKKGPRTVRAIMPGVVRAVSVEPGTRVAEHDALLVLEAMKMQNEIRAEVEGTVTRVHVKVGQSVAAGAPLLEVEC